MTLWVAAVVEDLPCEYEARNAKDILQLFRLASVHVTLIRHSFITLVVGVWWFKLREKVKEAHEYK